MINTTTNYSIAADTEFTVRQVIDTNQPGNLLAGPFTSEQEAHEVRKLYQNAAVFKECWLK